MRRLVLLFAVLALVLAGCGGDDESGGGSSSSESTPAEASGGGQQLALSSPEDGSLEFDKTELTAKAGKVTINYDNPSSTPHAVEIEGNGVEEESDTVTGGKASVTAELEPGTYTFYCPVSDHREQGMEGTLTVE